MKKVEKIIQEIHAGSCVAVPRTPTAPSNGYADSARSEVEELPAASLPSSPFALIDEVSEGSPAQEAGLLVGDLVCNFGSVSRRDTGDLNACFAAVAKEVQQCVG